MILISVFMDAFMNIHARISYYCSCFENAWQIICLKTNGIQLSDELSIGNKTFLNSLHYCINQIRLFLKQLETYRRLMISLKKPTQIHNAEYFLASPARSDLEKENNLTIKLTAEFLLDL